MLLGGCASLVATDTKPLPASRLEPPGAEQISSGGYRLDEGPRSERADDLLIIVAMSGGGKRSAAFSYGALRGMRELRLNTRNGPHPMLEEIDVLSGVSGGSFTAAYYGLHRDAMFGRYEADFLYRDTEASIYGIYLLPWNWTWLINPLVGTNDFMERVYDREMFRGARFADLGPLGRPVVAIGSTDIASGAPFPFIQESFDLICSDLDQFPLARAVAASNGFPGLLSPITLTNHARECGNRIPGWLRRVTEAERLDPRSRTGAEAREADRYLNYQRSQYVHLIDGGASDNLALRAAGATIHAVSASPEDLVRSRVSHIRRVLILSVDGQAAQDTSVAERRIVGGLFSVFRLVSGAQIDRFNFETLTVVDQQLQGFVQAVKDTRCAQGPTIDGVPCGDVDGALIQVSLTGLPESPEKDRLLAIRTGLTLPHQDVNALVEAGRSAILDSAPLRDFLRNYPAQAFTTASARVGTGVGGTRAGSVQKLQTSGTTKIDTTK